MSSGFLSYIRQKMGNKEESHRMGITNLMSGLLPGPHRDAVEQKCKVLTGERQQNPKVCLFILKEFRIPFLALRLLV
jgi:hypothetical protein